MAIDTREKRQAATARSWSRLPFGRRLRLPFPNGSGDVAGRAQLAGEYYLAPSSGARKASRYLPLHGPSTVALWINGPA